MSWERMVDINWFMFVVKILANTQAQSSKPYLPIKNSAVFSEQRLFINFFASHQGIPVIFTLVLCKIHSYYDTLHVWILPDAWRYNYGI